MLKKTLLIFCSLFFASALFAQNVRIAGVVISGDDNQPIIGANIIIRGTHEGTITNFNGQFDMTVPQGSVVVFSFMGYQAHEQTITAANNAMRIVLQTDANLLDEFVVVGFGVMRRSDLTGAVASVRPEELQRTPLAGVDQALQGRVPGVTVNANSGQPGQAATIRIRGIGSAMAGSDPIFVVDGILTENINFLNPGDIETFEILRDASATAIFGSRGANGVILITTRSGGRDGRSNISVDASWGFQNRWRKLDLMGGQEMLDTHLRIVGSASLLRRFQDGGINAHLAGVSANPNFPVVLSPLHPDGFDYSTVNTCWQDAIFRPNAPIQQYSVSIDGGTEQGQFAFSMSYFTQQGTIIGSYYDRLTLRFNSSFQVRDWLRIGETMAFMSSRGRMAMHNSAAPGASIISAALAMAPWDPTHYPKGTFNIHGQDLSGRVSASTNNRETNNPFSFVTHTHPRNQTERFVTSLFAEITPTSNWLWRNQVSFDLSLVRNRNFFGAYSYSDFDTRQDNFLVSNMARWGNIQGESTLTYMNTIGRSRFSIMGGTIMEELNGLYIGGSGGGILNPVPTNWLLGNTTINRNFGESLSRSRMQSFITRWHYSFDNRYVATVTFRADGSSRFPEHTWGFFPSTALAWNMHAEEFMQDFPNIEILRTRFGWGRVGNSEGIGQGTFRFTIHDDNLTFTGYPFGPNPPGGADRPPHWGAAVLTIPNMGGRWETNEQMNIGVDFRLHRGLISGNVDLFRRNTLDAFFPVPTPAHVGNRFMVVQNIGNIRNEGIEINLNHQNRLGGFSYSVGGNVSFIRNEVTALNGGEAIDSWPTMIDVGMPLGVFWGYVFEGIFATDEEAAAHAWGMPGTFRAGDARFAVNEYGVIERRRIGNPFPWLTYGFNIEADWRGFDLSLFLQGVHGNQILNAVRFRTEGSGAGSVLSTTMRDAWIGYNQDQRAAMEAHLINWMALENRNGTIPNQSPHGASQNNALSSRLIESGSYFRLKNLQLGYTLPQNLTRQVGVERARFYVAANNLFTITNYTGFDPEVGNTYGMMGVDHGNFPQSRTIMFGVNLNF